MEDKSPALQAWSDWYALVDSSLPIRRFNLKIPDGNVTRFQNIIAKFAKPEVERGSPYYGDYILITSTESEIQFEAAFDDKETLEYQESRVIMEAIINELTKPVEWYPYSFYEDSGESAGFRKGKIPF